MQAGDGERCGRCVLVVDDNAGMRRVLIRLLHAHNLTAVEATSMEEAMASAERYRFHAIILDLNLGDQSGLDVLVCLRRTPGHGAIPILLLTGQTLFARDDLALIRRHDAHLFLKPHLSFVEHLVSLLGHEGIATDAPQLHH